MPESRTQEPILSAEFDRALVFASEQHRGQLRKGTEIPYVSHLLAVASLVLEMGGDEREAIAALVHDAVEDAVGDEDEYGRTAGQRMQESIRAEFGDDVLRIVMANSDTDEQPKPPWHQRKAKYVAGIAGKAPDELRVSLADKLHNSRAILLDLRTHGDGLWDRFSGDQEDVRWYYRKLCNAFERRRDAIGPQASPVLDEFRRTVAEIDRLSG